MTTSDLARAYVIKARKRMRALEVLREEDAFSDVVREAQELVELCLKALLRSVGVDPPHWHDVGEILLLHQDRFPDDIRSRLPRLADISRRLHRDRELSFYGTIDVIPTEEYGPAEADEALGWAREALDAGFRVVLEDARP